MRTLLLSAAVALLGFSPQDGQVQKLIAQLGSDNVEEREQASRELIQIGKKALEGLRAAEKTASLDVRQRTRDLIAEIDWPEPGAAANGLALAIKAEPEYGREGQLLLRGRLANQSDKEVVVVGAESQGVTEGGAFHLRLNEGKDLYHLCYRRQEPAPDLPARLPLKKGERKSFTFSPRAWCGLIEHSKCAPLAINQPVSYRVSLMLILDNKVEGEWKGRLESNEVSFRLK